MTCRTSGRWATVPTRRSCWRRSSGRGTASAAGASRSSTPATAAVLFASGDESSRWTGPRGRCEGSTRPRGSPTTCCSLPAGRRAARCRSCASWYRRDAFHLVAAGLRGDKGIPDSVESHPKVFATFTAPSFGAVHVRRVKGRKTLPCRPRDKARVCPHGVRVGCSVRHAEGDPAIGTPLCLECFDAEGQVIWNAMAPALWHRTWTYFSRELAAVMGMSHRKLLGLVKPRMVKVAEYQRRGAVHFHAIIRLDAAPPADDQEAVAPPPEQFTLEVLERAVRAVRES